MTDARVFAMAITFLTTVAAWVLMAATLLHGASNSNLYPQTQNPFYPIGMFFLIPAIISTGIAIVVWADGLTEAKRGKA